MTDKPTPKEIDDLVYELRQAGKDDTYSLASAVLKKWGQPAQAAEPVAWLRNTTDPQPHAVTNLKYRSAVDAKAGVEYIPVFAAPQPVAREPLSDELEALAKRHGATIYRNRADEEMRLIRIGWDAAHGIKGGQHGTE